MSDHAETAARPPWTASPEEVAAFVQRHGRPYDPQTDDYEDPGPFARAVKQGKNSPIYNAHAYHTKVPPESIVAYLEHYTRPGDLVLDPFCGSGMTGVACLLTGRYAILNDLSPAATHIAYNYCTPVDTAALRREFERIKAAVREEFDWLYGTTCDRGHPATILYTIWSDVHQCRACREDIVLWDAAVDHATGKVLESFRCPSCGKGPWKKTELALLRTEPVLTAYACHGGCRPARASHATTAAERARLAEIEAADIPYWYPTTPFGDDREMWRGGHRDHGITRVCDFWTKRNLRALARLWHEISSLPRTLQPKLRFAFSGVCQGLTKRCRYLPGNPSFPLPIQSGTLYVPSLSKEANAITSFENKLLLRVLALPKQIKHPLGSAAITTAPAGQTMPLLDCAIDYVFTDPPFGANIFYADCSLLWEAWLGHYTDERYEAVWNKHKKPSEGGKTLDDYERLMTDAFREMHRVLKPGRWASVVFHNSDDRVWQAIQRGAVAAGFEVVNALQLDKVQLTFKGVKGDKGEEDVTNKDVILNLQKPLGRPINGFRLAPDAEAVVAEAILAHLGGGPPADERGLQALQGLAIRALLNQGYQVEVSWRSVSDTLRDLGCKQVDGRWYLPGDDVAGATFEIRDEASAIGWLRQVIEQQGPQRLGTLIPRFQEASAGVVIRKELRELLGENFVLDEPTNTWRLPTPQERERLNDAKALGQRREIRRWLAGKAGRHYDDVELAELALAAFGFGLHEAVLAIAPLVRAEALPDSTRNELDQVQVIARMKLEASREAGAVQLPML